VRSQQDKKIVPVIGREIRRLAGSIADRCDQVGKIRIGKGKQSIRWITSKGQMLVEFSQHIGQGNRRRVIPPQ